LPWPCEPRAFAAEPRWTLDEILDALRRVETGGVPDAASAIGDGGAAIGPFQIHRAYWQDAEVAGSFDDCRDADYARRVVIAYWERYCPEALRSHDAEALARTHNGGPKGRAHRRATDAFWKRVKSVLDEVTDDRPAG
jgi:hypothetical protein